jgi:hypothetical protein
MPKQEVPLNHLENYLPDNCLEDVLDYLYQFKVQLTVTKQRQSILGDYRNAHQGKAHRISVNGNLNKYSFLITLLHELAHLLTYEKHKHHVAPHGKEWKQIFSSILAKFLSKKIFPLDIETALMNTLKNPAASSCGDLQLLRTLKKYDRTNSNLVLVEEVPTGKKFSIKGDRIFLKGEKIRTRHKCKEVDTGKFYLFNGLYEVKLVDDFPNKEEVL